eukprot:TRINITY_DN109710_c0_g1_i1.p1 TRINITY_DN109710_c0_g1~~TRINITY_DN109710_c0_g1_i1.p1  ORF type:complete len:195 (-),score=33.50 TRINITY_DN109710_c0_g1_i1:123-626(-)
MAKRMPPLPTRQLKSDAKRGSKGKAQGKDVKGGIIKKTTLAPLCSSSVKQASIKKGSRRPPKEVKKAFIKKGSTPSSIAKPSKELKNAPIKSRSGKSGWAASNALRASKRQKMRAEKANLPNPNEKMIQTDLVIPWTDDGSWHVFWMPDTPSKLFNQVTLHLKGPGQ